MRTLLSMALLAALATLAGCGDRRTPATPPDTTAAPSAPVAAAPAPAPPTGTPAPSAADTGGSLRVDAPAEGAITFAGFGPAKFGASAEQVRMAWGGDLGDEKPLQAGGCYYLTPRGAGDGRPKVAFMIEADEFVRVEGRSDKLTAPGGGKVGMTRAQVAALYAGIEERPHKYTDGQYLRVRDPAGGAGVLLFETDGKGDDARVTAWRVGLPPQVDYVEGCS
ncbi:MAG: lectin [Lysobacteraceae bacterium]|nr:MAG: lectin [Xanthomonadaceae bacterium]